MSALARPAPMLVIAPDEQLPATASIWGTGGWMNPEEREALDWLTLARMLGWGVDRSLSDAESIAKGGVEGRRWIILACEPALLDATAIGLLKAALEREPLTLIGRATSAGSAWSGLCGVVTTGEAVTGHRLRWCDGSQLATACRQPFSAFRATVSDGALPLAEVDGMPILFRKSVGRGEVASLAFHPSAARDANGAATALLRDMLIRTGSRPLAWIDFAQTIALRMDDPGAAQNVHLRSWQYRQLDGAAWQRIGAMLAARAARLSVGYVSGWVDDGDAARGTLTVGGRTVERAQGRIHPSAEVVYRELDSAQRFRRINDYAGQYRALRALQTSGVIDIALHGYTHMHPDTVAWAAAPDRYDDVGWYRELGARAEPSLAKLAADTHPLARGIAAIEHYFGVRPSTLICPGDAWTNGALETALALGIHAVSSYYFALRHDDRLCWAQHVCAPYLDKPDAAWFDSGLPVVGYFHDADLALHGVDWLASQLDAWSIAGARHFVTLREVTAAAQVRLEIGGGADSPALEVRCAVAFAGAMTLPVRFHLGDPADTKALEIVAGPKPSSYSLCDSVRGEPNSPAPRSGGRR